MDVMLTKQQRIIAAAEKVFASHGYEKATLDEIIAIADVGKGTVYKYFGNKEQLFYELVQKKNEVLVQRLDAAVTHAQGLEAKLVAFFTEMITFYKANAALWQIICFEMLGNNNGCMVHSINGVPTVVSRYEVTPSPELKEQMIRYHLILESEFSILQSIIQTATEEKLLKPNDVEVSTMFVFFGVAMCIFHPHIGVESASAEELAKITVDRFLTGAKI